MSPAQRINQSTRSQHLEILEPSLEAYPASTRRSCDGAIRGGDGESSSAPLTVRVVQVRPRALKLLQLSRSWPEGPERSGGRRSRCHTGNSHSAATSQDSV